MTALPNVTVREHLFSRLNTPCLVMLIIKIFAGVFQYYIKFDVMELLINLLIKGPSHLLVPLSHTLFLSLSLPLSLYLSLSPSFLSLSLSPQVKLVIVDSIAGPFRHGFEDMGLRNRLLSGIAQNLIKLATQSNIAVGSKSNHVLPL